MTCIVALETPRGVWMGSDRAGSDGYTIGPVTSPKTFHNGLLLIGYTSSFRMGQLLQYALQPPLHSLGWDIDRWVATDLMQALRAAYATHGWDSIRNNVAEGGNFLLAIRGRCYEIQADYSFLRSPTGEYAVGSGCYHALGSLHATRDWAKPKARVLAALEAAEEHVATVAGPFDVIRKRHEM